MSEILLDAKIRKEKFIDMLHKNAELIKVGFREEFITAAMHFFDDFPHSRFATFGYADTISEETHVSEITLSLLLFHGVHGNLQFKGMNGILKDVPLECLIVGTFLIGDANCVVPDPLLRNVSRLRGYAYSRNNKIKIDSQMYAQMLLQPKTSLVERELSL